MDVEAQRGGSLVETAVAIAIVALVAGSATGVVAIVVHDTAGSATREALQSELRREMSLAVDALKYRGTTLLPATAATTLPMPAGSPLAAQVRLRTAPLSGGGLRISIEATAVASRERRSLSATLDAQAPQPGAVVEAPGLAPAPTGAP